MASDETKLPKSPADAQGDDALPVGAPSRYAVDDFRLRLDSPLFHRDPGMGAAQAQQLRELTWEHVVRPTQQTLVNDGNDGSAVGALSSSSPSIESLLADALNAQEPLNFVEQLRRVEPLKPFTTFSGEVPAVAVPMVELAEVETPDAAEPMEVPLAMAPVAAAPVAALYSVDDETHDAPVLPPAKPRIDSLLAALEQMDEAPVAPELDDVPARDDESVPPISRSVPAVAVAVATISAVEAELNRLAFLPDQDEELGRVVVPTIAHSDQRVDASLPRLSQHELYIARNAAPVPRARLNHVDVSTTFIPVSRRRKRNGFARFATFLVFVALIGGAAYAGKYYFLDKRWEGDVKAMVSDVEAARGLSFDDAIAITTLPTTDYASKLVTSSFGLSSEALALEANAWRAVGILDGPLNLGEIGMAALPNSPAFYDPAEETIFVAKDMPEDLYRFGMYRALTLALLDQKFGWSDRAQDASPSVARGIKAYYDADALAVAVGMTTPTERTDIIAQIFGLYVDNSIGASPAPFASAVASRLGVALLPYFESTTDEVRATQDKDFLPTDGQVLDLRRLTSGVAESTTKTSQGMLFWYHALAGRIDENTAWQAALAWQDDDTSVVESAAGTCVVAHLQVDQSSLEAVNAAFQAWAAAAPPTSGTTVALATTGSPMQLQINACDPGPGVPTTSALGYLGLGGAPLRAEQFRLLLAAQPTLPLAQAACAVFGGDAVSMADERGVIEGAEGWPAPANHPLPDPNRLGCAPV